MMSQLCVKLRSFAQLIFHPECLSDPPTETTAEEEEEEEEEADPEDKEQEQDDESTNGLQPPQNFSPTSRTADDHVFPVHCFGPAIRSHASNSSIKTRVHSESGASSTAVPSTKQIQNIYRKPMSRINSNPSLRRSRDPLFRCHQRLTRHFQLFDSDPSDIYYYYSPSGSTHLPQQVNDRPGQGSMEEEPSAQGTSYRRRVYTMPSAPSQGMGTKVPHSQKISRAGYAKRDVAGTSKNVELNSQNTEIVDGILNS